MTRIIIVVSSCYLASFNNGLFCWLLKTVPPNFLLLTAVPSLLQHAFATISYAKAPYCNKNLLYSTLYAENYNKRARQQNSNPEKINPFRRAGSSGYCGTPDRQAVEQSTMQFNVILRKTISLCKKKTKCCNFIKEWGSSKKIVNRQKKHKRRAICAWASSIGTEEKGNSLGTGKEHPILQLDWVVSKRKWKSYGDKIFGSEINLYQIVR